MIDRIAYLELHHRHAGELRRQPGGAEIVLHRLADLGDRGVEALATDDLGIEREHHQRQRAVLRQQLAADDLVGEHALLQGVIGRPGRQFLGEQRRRQLARLRRLPRREQRDQAAHAVDQLQIGDKVTDFLDGPAVHQILALDDDENVVLGRGKALGHLFVLVELLCVGAEQLAERVVNLEAVDAESRRDAEQRQNYGGQYRCAQRDQADPLEAVCEIMQLARRGSSSGRLIWRGIFCGHRASFRHVVH
jgi:hypothetical protein